MSTRCRVVGVLALLLVSIGVFPQTAEATHFRFGLITWVARPDLGPNTVEFTVTQSWRRSACGPVVVGSPACNFSSLTFGDSTAASIVGTVVSIDVAADWYIATYQVIHTYPSPNNGGVPWAAAFNNCCRISTLVNAADQPFNVRTDVDLSIVNTAPVTSLFPIVQMAVNTTNNITIPVGDADGDTLSCRLATTLESQLPSQPAGLSVTPGCVLTWNTASTSVGQLYAAQVIIEESRDGNSKHGQVALDFVIQIVQSIGSAPVCDVPPTPTGTVTIPLNAVYTATIQGSDADGGSLTLNTTGLPAGATLTPGAGTSGASPYSSTFSWVPTTPGVYPLQFSFTDGNGQAAFCSFTLNVPANQSPVAQCAAATVNAPAGSCSATASINNGSFDPDGDAITLVQSPAGPYGLGSTNVTLTVTDPFGVSSSCSAVVTVLDAEAPILQCKPGSNPGGREPAASNEDGFFRIVGGDSCSATSITLGASTVANGETIKLTQAPGATGVTLINTMGSGIRHFKVGPGDAQISATDAAGNVTTVSCLVPPPPK